jgi:hypothetical protein
VPAAGHTKKASIVVTRRKGALDMSLYPLAYAGGEVAELNIGLMPCMVTSYEQGFAKPQTQETDQRDNGRSCAKVC